MNPNEFRKKPVVVQAMRIEPDTADTGALDPNTRTIAEISGWMMGNQFHDFKVHGESPFGICKPDIFEQTYEPADALNLINAISSAIDLLGLKTAEEIGWLLQGMRKEAATKAGAEGTDA